jgi:hypothetical protein
VRLGIVRIFTCTGERLFVDMNDPSANAINMTSLRPSLHRNWVRAVEPAIAYNVMELVPELIKIELISKTTSHVSPPDVSIKEAPRAF